MDTVLDRRQDSVNPRVFSFTDDLTHSQFQNLLMHLWRTNQAPTPAVLKAWRRKNGLPVDWMD